MTKTSRTPCFKKIISSFVLATVIVNNTLWRITRSDNARSCYSWRKMNLFHADVINWGHKHVGTSVCTHMCMLTYVLRYMCIFRQCFCKQNKIKLLYVCPYLPPSTNGLFVSPLNNHLSWALLYREVMINIMAHVQRVEKPYSFSKSRCID